MKYFTRKNLIILSIVLLVLALGWFLNQNGGVISVQEYTVTKRPIVKTISASGETKSPDDFIIRAPFTGKVVKVSTKSGETVLKGQEVLEFDKLALSASLSSAWQAYLVAKAAFDSHDNQLEAAKSAIDNKKYIRDKEEREHREDSSFDNKQSLKTAEADYQSAISAYQTLADKKDSLSEAVNSSWSTYLVAKDNQAKGVLMAPEPGLVALHDIQPGSQITVGQKLFSITNNSIIQFTAEVDEADIQRIIIGQKVEVTLEGYPDQAFVGEVMLVDAKTRITSSGSTVVDVLIRISPENISPILGMTGTARIEIGREAETLAIPFDSLFTESEDSYYVFIISGNKVLKRTVKIGFEGDEYYAILDGLSENDKIAVGTNLGDLKDGSKISIVKN